MQNNLRKEIESAKANNNKLVIASDLLYNLPPSPIDGPAFYLRKTQTYNLGIRDCVTEKAYTITWTETKAKRESEEISQKSTYIPCSEETTGHEALAVFTDNYIGQNKNWLIMSFWLQIVSEKKLKAIEHRFLVSGHKYLHCDREFCSYRKT